MIALGNFHTVFMPVILSVLIFHLSMSMNKIYNYNLIMHEGRVLTQNNDDSEDS
jgi:hypothetical protein